MTIKEAQDILATLEEHEWSWDYDPVSLEDSIRQNLSDAFSYYREDLRVRRANGSVTHWMLCQRRQDIYYWASLAVANHFIP